MPTKHVQTLRTYTTRLTHAVGAVLTVAALALPGATPAVAAPTRAPACPETRAQLAGQHITSDKDLPSLTCADLKGAVLDDLDLTQVDLSGADATGASFRHTDLTQATLTGAVLRDAHFDHAELSQADLDQVDARGASFADADLVQADLRRADLRDANFNGASLSQADLRDADLRGAKTVLAEAIQADVSGARVDLTYPGTFQAALLAVVLGLVLLVRSALDVLRGRTTGGKALARGLRRLLIYVPVSGFVWLIVGMLLPLMFVIVFYPLLAGAVLVFLSGVVRGHRPARFGRPEQAPAVAVGWNLMR